MVCLDVEGSKLQNTIILFSLIVTIDNSVMALWAIRDIHVELQVFL
jgi:hypothetical protein